MDILVDELKEARIKELMGQRPDEERNAPSGLSGYGVTGGYGDSLLNPHSPSVPPARNEPRRRTLGCDNAEPERLSMIAFGDRRRRRAP